MKVPAINCFQKPNCAGPARLRLALLPSLESFSFQATEDRSPTASHHSADTSFESFTSISFYSSTSIGGNNLDLWLLNGTQLRCRSERTNRDESRHGSGSGRSQENMRSAPVAGIGQRRVDRLS